MIVFRNPNLLFPALILLSACSDETMQNLESTNTGRTVAEGAAAGGVICGLLSALGGGDEDEVERAAAGCAVIGAGVGTLVANEQGKLARQEAALKTQIRQSKAALNRLIAANDKLVRQIRSGRVTQAALNEQLAAMEAAKREREALRTVRPVVRPIRGPGGDTKEIIGPLDDQIALGGELRKCLREGTCRV